MSSGAILAESLHPRRTALVVWDLQAGIAGNAANKAELEAQLPRLISGARAAGCRVIWSRHVGLPVNQMSDAMRRVQLRYQTGNDEVVQFMPKGSPEGEWVNWAAPEGDDLVIEKSQPTFFVGTGLESLLRAWSVDTLVLTGVATDHGIDLTARHGLALGFTCVVASDATGSFTSEAHEDGIARLSATAEVLTVEEILANWSKAVEAS